MKITNEWASGFIEGDGCFTVVKSNYKDRYYSYPAIKISQKNHEPLYAMKDLYGGSVSNYEDGGKKWWSVSGKKAVAAYNQIAPYLSDKRYEQALAAGFPERSTRTDKGFDWFAGLYEAEGCAILRSNGRHYYKYPTLVVTQYYSDQILFWCKRAVGAGNVGGPYSAGKHGFVAYAYRVNGQAALDTAEKLYRYLSLSKKQQIDFMKNNSTLGKVGGR